MEEIGECEKDFVNTKLIKYKVTFLFTWKFMAYFNLLLRDQIESESSFAVVLEGILESYFKDILPLFAFIVITQISSSLKAMNLQKRY